MKQFKTKGWEGAISNPRVGISMQFNSRKEAERFAAANSSIMSYDIDEDWVEASVALHDYDTIEKIYRDWES
jgi:hypothetical protein